MTFTIDAENNITAHATPEEAAAATATPFDTFTTRQELADLIAAWPPERIPATFNTLPGVAPVKNFKSVQAAASRIWKQIQSLGEAAQTETGATKQKPTKKKSKR